MKIKVFIFIFLLSPTLFGQVNYAKEPDYKKFILTKTMVVLENTLFSSYNEQIKKSVESVWKITPYEFISAKEFDDKKNNSAYSFIILTDAFLEQKGSVMQYNMLNLILGGKAKNINAMPDLGSIPISYTDEDDENYLYKIGGLLQFMQYFVHYNLSHPNTDLLKLIKNIETNIGNKEIWLLKQEVAPEINTLEKIMKYYQGIVKFVNSEAIETAILQKNTNVVFLHKIGNAEKGNICWKVLMNAGNGEVVYFDQYQIDTKHPDAFTAEDFKKLKSN